MERFGALFFSCLLEEEKDVLGLIFGFIRVGFLKFEFRDRERE